MSLKTEIADQEGNFVSLGRILRTACVLMKCDSKKKLSSKSIQFAIRFHFTEEKLNNAIKMGVKRLVQNIEDKNPNNKKIVRDICFRFGVDKIEPGPVHYLNGIYDDIDKYELEESFEYVNDLDIEYFLKCNSFVMEFLKNKNFNEKHLEITRQILFPEDDFRLNWTIEKDEKSLKNYLKFNFNQSKINNLFISSLLNIYKLFLIPSM